MILRAVMNTVREVHDDSCNRIYRIYIIVSRQESIIHALQSSQTPQFHKSSKSCITGNASYIFAIISRFIKLGTSL